MRSMKNVLCVTLKESHSKEEILSLIMEADNLLNGSSGAAPHTEKFEEVKVNLRKQWRVSQSLADVFFEKMA